MTAKIDIGNTEDSSAVSVEPTALFAVGSRWWPRCAKCGKTADHAEILGGSSVVKRYRVRCHGQEEEHLVGIWAAAEYASKGCGLPDSFTANAEPTDRRESR